GWDARKRAYCLKIQPATGSFARNLIYSTKPSQSTLKLKNELRDEIDGNQYKIVTTSYMLRGGIDHSKGYVFVLTPERLVSLISTCPDIIIDYIFVDEAQ
ncbi:hypothetical protein, partial [Klebsiella pneumoniae]